MSSTLTTLQTALETILKDQIKSLHQDRGELTLLVSAENYLNVALTLKKRPDLGFEQLIDLCGVDYSAFRNGTGPECEGARYGVSLHLLSVANNWRLRLKVACPQDDWPSVASVNSVWSAANWYEREAFDLYGIVFAGHEDLRRLLTDYGFVGHPFRKDFPTTGYMEMRYDEQQKRVIYQPVSIEAREITPRIVREDHYGGLH